MVSYIIIQAVKLGDTNKVGLWPHWILQRNMIWEDNYGRMEK